MKIVNTGTIYRIYGEDLKTFDSLPIGTYRVCFNKMVGYYLEKIPNINVNEKIYGPHEEKVTKILKSFKVFERNLGVILSGDKGIGKSICAKLISQRAIEEGLPVIVVDGYTPGIANYLSEIEQEVVVLFDEFDKTFPVGRCNCDEESSSDSSQSELLTLFDGLNQGKKLFVVTCNKLSGLNEFLVNRPGRFHYHLRFEYPTPEEIREYLKDKLELKYHDQIEKVVSFSGKVDINYDCLRAIAFELQMGLSFKEAIKDLNIINYDVNNEYSVTMLLKDGTKLKVKSCCIDFYSEENYFLRFYGDNLRIEVEFDPTDGEYNSEEMVTVLTGDKVNVCECCNSERDDIELPSEVSCIIFKKKQTKVLKYMV